MNIAFLHLGSNTGDRLDFITQAMELIENRIGKIQKKSSFYETEAWGMKDQDDFINIALSVDTSLTALQVLNQCKKIESDLGNKKEEKWGPRCIDIDLLFWNDAVIRDEQLTLPHPHIEERNFVLIPMMEIAAEWVHPVQQKTIEEIYDECNDNCEVMLYEC